MLQIGTKAPCFEGVDENGNTVKLSDFAGKKLVLYFYPKECTPGCTTYCSHLMYSSPNTRQSSCYLEDDINFLNF